MSSEWVSLREAASILGVHPATVRNWADKGEIPSRRTPGGHRRFNRTDLERHAQSNGERQPIEVQVIIQNALGSTRMQVGDGDLADIAWYHQISETSRRAMRQQGREVLEALRRYLGETQSELHLQEAVRLGQKYAELLSADGLTLPQATRGFLYFSEFVVDSVLTWSEVTPPRNSGEWVVLLRNVNTFIHAMLLSIIEYYQED
ncbi:MAG: MerR family transcriptional regulator [Aggregatilineales bacterium]